MKILFKISIAFALFFSVSAQAQNQPVKSRGMAKFSKNEPFKPYDFTRRPVGDNDILIEIMYASICHSDIHGMRGEWGGEPEYPVVPGHEIAGKVTQVGKNVTKFKVGDYAGIGCIVSSCGKCDYCKEGHEQYCKNRFVHTYGAHDYMHDNEKTQGGYSNNYVITADYAIKIPKTADMTRIAPVLCAGVTVYSPMMFSEVKAGDDIAVAGFGGLGHMAVKYAVAKGAKVTVFDITEDKRADALKMGAVKYVNTKNASELEGFGNKFSYIISTIPAKYDPMVYVSMLKKGGEFAIVGAPASVDVPSIPINRLTFSANHKIYGSMIGGIPETQEVVDYSVANNIYPDVEIITPDNLDQAYDNIVAGKVKFRYVIDMSKLK